MIRRFLPLVLLLVLVVALVGVAAVSRSIGDDSRADTSRTTQGTQSQQSAPKEPLPPVAEGTEVTVTDAASLKSALADARPGLTITMSDGMYLGKEVRDGKAEEPGRFAITTPGTAEAPITLRGTRNAIIDGGGSGGGYGLHLTRADHWRLLGFTVKSASKGIVLDRSNHVVLDGVRVTETGQEGVHFRAFSSDNVIKNSEVDNTGLKSPNFGEGVYIGSAVSNWERYSDGKPDTSDRNQVLDNRITATAAENIDIKEGSSDGVVRGNFLDGSKIAGKNSADSWIDVKGNDYLIEKNHGVNSRLDGMQVHVLAKGWGERNVFRQNTLEVNADGVGIWLQNTAVDKGNILACDNQISGAKVGKFATNHYSMLDCQ